MKVLVDAQLEGTLVRRYKRFLADIELPNGEVRTVHCPNSGSMLGMKEPGSAVRCSTSDNPKRKLRHSLEMIRVDGVWVGIHSALANRLAAEVLRAGFLSELAGYADIRPEVRVGPESRLDFRLSGHASDPRPAYVEVKSVTLAEGRTGRFPDAVTERGRRHMQTLAKVIPDGARAIVLFVAQRADVDCVEPADEIDPAYGEALRSAVRDGVEVLAVGARVSARSITVDRHLPVRL